MQDLLVLCYHAVSSTWPAELSVTPDALTAQTAELASRGYVGARFSEAVSGKTRHERVVVFTFDDNYRSVLELAKPILDRHGFPGTLYVPSDWPGQQQAMRWAGIDRWLGTEHEPEMLSLRWQELRELAEAGWEIGSHTCSHPRLPELDDAALERELSTSKQAIERELGRPCASLAYPYGAVDARVRRATGRAGYECAATIPRMIPAPEPLLWPRVPIFHKDGMRRFKLKISPAVRRARASNPGVLLDRARVGVGRAFSR
jgi:peptidoglycan/xylan/chitin deacetylase (PgdA/CDA1 family)